jgi:DNA-directed RNA polymerase specialized sigma24 family protein
MSRESEVLQRAAAAFIRDRNRLGAFVGGLLRDAHAAEDVIQEVCGSRRRSKRAPSSTISRRGAAGSRRTSS